MDKSYFKSAIGNLEIVSDNNQLISLKLVDKIQISDIENNFIKDIKYQLEEYFLGKRKFFDIKINPKGTEFQKYVWSELQRIPYGTTKSYSEIAMACKNKNASRAVGNACNKNPIMIIIPCHRVILKKQSLGGFAYGNSVKQKLLEIENYYI